MKRDKYFCPTIVLFCCILFVQSCSLSPKNPDEKILSVPVLYPDYSDVTFPPNIAAPNFEIREFGERFQTEIGYDGETKIRISKKSPQVRIPLRKWHKMLQEAKGKNIFFRITILKNGRWIQYANVENAISESGIDEYLAYRLLYPGYELWNKMGIYQRQLSSYRETAILENSSVGGQCMNCHTFRNNSPDAMMLHVRGKQGGTVIYNKGKLEKVNTKAPGMHNAGTYPSWHPSGRFIAFSVNEIQQFFHSTGQKPIEVSDLAADIVLYDVENHVVMADSLLMGDRYMETFPNWSPDGKTLYFCRADGYTKSTRLDSIRYDLYKVSFDPEVGRFADTVCVYRASAEQKSISFPRISPDGAYLIFVRSDYGNFSIWHPESDLYILDISSGEIRRMEELNSHHVESFHSWSSDGKWLVFSSKRLDGLWARPYFSAFDAKTGIASKPFLLPQKDPLFYDTFTKTYNLPELITSPVTIGSEIPDLIMRKDVINAGIKK